MEGLADAKYTIVLSNNVVNVWQKALAKFLFRVLFFF